MSNTDFKDSMKTSFRLIVKVVCQTHPTCSTEKDNTNNYAQVESLGCQQHGSRDSGELKLNGSRSYRTVILTSKEEIESVGLKEVEDNIWLVSFMDYDLGYIDLVTKSLQPLDNPYGPRVSPMCPE